ncbi:MAG: DUF370 domain-containing protein [Oscillospiraceae bacterium]|jgi:regulator of extracellular matrix RemA (YlzA/DUF370 family)|nr:DUF370 domain-containing protein [Oscillospiraceae bacterium]
MDNKLINIGFGNFVSASRVLTLIQPDSAPVKRVISDARESAKLIDATFGRKTLTVIFCDTGHIVLSALAPELIALRLSEDNAELFGDDEETANG